MEFTIFEILVFFAVVLNVLVSIHIMRRIDLNSFQKKSQIIIVWLFPFIASLGIYFFHNSETKNTKSMDNKNNNDIDIARGSE